MAGVLKQAQVLRDLQSEKSEDYDTLHLLPGGGRSRMWCSPQPPGINDDFLGLFVKVEVVVAAPGRIQAGSPLCRMFRYCC